MATRTHWARIVTMLCWQNISLCALLINLSTYYTVAGEESNMRGDIPPNIIYVH